MRVHPGQTLILAGELLPRRNVGGSSSNTVVAGRNGSTLSNTQRASLFSARAEPEVTDAEYTPSVSVSDADVVADDAADVSDVNDTTALPVATPKNSSLMASRAYSSYASSSRGSSFGGASAYARTQDLSERHPIIDTYA